LIEDGDPIDGAVSTIDLPDELVELVFHPLILLDLRARRNDAQNEDYLGAPLGIGFEEGLVAT